MPLEIIFLDYPVGPYARHQRAFETTGPRASISGSNTPKGRARQLDRPAVCEQLAAMRQQQETPERDAGRCFGSGMH